MYQHNPSIASSRALIQHYRLFYNCVSYTFPFFLCCFAECLGWEFGGVFWGEVMGFTRQTLTGAIADQRHIMRGPPRRVDLGHLFVLFFSSTRGQSRKIFFSPSTVPRFWLAVLGWGGMYPDDIHFPLHPHAFSSSFIAYHRHTHDETTRMHPLTHTHWFLSFLLLPHARIF